MPVETNIVIIGKAALEPTIFGITNRLEKFGGNVSLDDYALGAEKAWDALVFTVHGADGKKFQCRVVYEDRGKPPVPEHISSANDTVNEILQKPACFYEIQTQDDDELLKLFVHFIALYFTKTCKGVLYEAAENTLYTYDEYQSKKL